VIHRDHHWTIRRDLTNRWSHSLRLTRDHGHPMIRNRHLMNLRNRHLMNLRNRHDQPIPHRNYSTTRNAFRIRNLCRSRPTIHPMNHRIHRGPGRPIVNLLRDRRMIHIRGRSHLIGCSCRLSCLIR
jgi:hypothetical protein